MQLIYPRNSYLRLQISMDTITKPVVLRNVHFNKLWQKGSDGTSTESSTSPPSGKRAATTATTDQAASPLKAESMRTSQESSTSTRKP